MYKYAGIESSSKILCYRKSEVIDLEYADPASDPACQEEEEEEEEHDANEYHELLHEVKVENANEVIDVEEDDYIYNDISITGEVTGFCLC